MRNLIIAIDGYSSCGKSSLAKDLAKELQYAYIDTGAMYRAVTYFAVKNKLIVDSKINELELEKQLEDIAIQFLFNEKTQTNEITLNGLHIEDEIRKPEIAGVVSYISALSFVRRKLVLLQQDMGKNKRIVMDGRDIGTVVFPEADYKFFMTANPLIRAQRRFDELVQSGINTTLEDVLENLTKRDLLDETRNDSPLRKANNAIEIDNSYLSKKDQLQVALNYILQHEN